jgi:hypothetical protein
LRQDLLFTSETYFAPIGDYSLSYLAGCKIGKLFDIGAGISFCRIVPLDPALTTPPGGIVYGDDNNPIIENGDTLVFTSMGKKIMGRLSFDPKPLLNSPNLFGLELGPADGILYVESAILGLKDYGSNYNDLLKRWPIMVGFKIPAFKILDVVSLELEYFAFQYNKIDFPQTTPTGVGQYSDFVSPNMFHWSIYAQKTLFSNFNIKGLIGKDHYRSTGTNTSGLNWVDMPTSPEYLMGPDDWHYKLRAMYLF